MASTSGGDQHDSTTSTARSSNACYTFHLVSFLIYLYVFCWHFSEQASTMPQAWEFGWYFKFLTFCGFAFQMVALMASFISHLMPEVRMLKRTANYMSCAGFEIANATTLTCVLDDPVKLGWRKAAHKTLHQGLRSSLYITILFMVVYGFWVHVCEARNKDFPHPFAKSLRQPDGSIIVSSLAFAFVLLFHKIGSWLTSRGTSPLARKIKLV